MVEMFFSLYNHVSQNSYEECEENDEGDDWIDFYPNYGLHVMFDEL